MFHREITIGGFREFPVSESENPKALSRPILILFQDLLPPDGRKRADAGGSEKIYRTIQQDIRSALGKEDSPLLYFVQGTHTFSERIERQFAQTRQFLTQLGNVKAGDLPHFQQSDFCRISQPVQRIFFIYSSIVGEYSGIEKKMMNGMAGIEIGRREPLIIDIDLLNTHPILSQCAGFIGTDDRYTA